jgi:S-adenosylmethionine hydrolase
MFVLVTDFGLEGPYTGQVKAVLARSAPGIPVIDLFADAPLFNPKATAYLLAAFCEVFPAGTIFVVVVDPGVGSDRPAGILQANGRWFVGPGNGVFELVMRRAENDGDCLGFSWWSLDDQTAATSATFHGRDIFAPAAVKIALEGAPRYSSSDAHSFRHRDWPDDLEEIVYIDGYGNAMTGVRAAMINPSAGISVDGVHIPFHRTFSDVGIGSPVCYENANGLLEIAVNQGDAARVLNLNVGNDIKTAFM